MDQPDEIVRKFKGKPLDWKNQNIFVPFRPKQPLSKVDLVTIFMSKKRPLLIESFRPGNTKSTEKFIFRYGDDLR